MSEQTIEAYSRVADGQLNEIEERDPDLYSDIPTICRLVVTSPGHVRSMSTPITTDDGIISRLAVPFHASYRVFWFSEEPRIEAIFPHP